MSMLINDNGTVTSTTNTGFTSSDSFTYTVETISGKIRTRFLNSKKCWPVPADRTVNQIDPIDGVILFRKVSLSEDKKKYFLDLLMDKDGYQIMSFIYSL